MANHPIFTIVTVTFNAASCIERTIQSVIEQDYENYEYIIVDGGSTDNTKEIVSQYKTYISHFVSEKDRGIYDGMNKGINLSKGDYLLFLNADDTFVCSSVLKQVADKIDMNADVVYGNWQLTTEYGTYHCVPKDIKFLNEKWVLSHQALFCRVSLLKKRPFDISYRFCGDYEQISYYYLSGKKFQYVNIEIANMPITGGATYDNYEKSVREHYNILKKRGIVNSTGLYWLLLRKKTVRFLKTALPPSIASKFFKFLADHYKVM